MEKIIFKLLIAALFGQAYMSESRAFDDLQRSLPGSITACTWIICSALAVSPFFLSRCSLIGYEKDQAVERNPTPTCDKLCNLLAKDKHHPEKVEEPGHKSTAHSTTPAVECKWSSHLAFALPLVQRHSSSAQQYLNLFSSQLLCGLFVQGTYLCSFLIIEKI
jgi:hypothetical protein